MCQCEALKFNPQHCKKKTKNKKTHKELSCWVWKIDRLHLQNAIFWASGVAQVVELLPSKFEVLSLNPRTG
jgi:hypothetical protein